MHLYFQFCFVDDAIFSLNAASRAESKTKLLHRVCQVVAPCAKSDVYDCLIFVDESAASAADDGTTATVCCYGSSTAAATTTTTTAASSAATASSADRSVLSFAQCIM